MFSLIPSGARRVGPHVCLQLPQRHAAVIRAQSKENYKKGRKASAVVPWRQIAATKPDLDKTIETKFYELLGHEISSEPQSQEPMN